MRFIGDVHGWMLNYQMIIHDVEESIQLGDFGAGFVELPKVSEKHRFIRGNHDNPAICEKSPNWIPDGIYEEPMFFVGGAWSIDWQSRTPGVSWWENEELSYRDLNGLIDKYESIKPEVMVTHDCPLIIARELHSLHFEDKSRTREAFNTMWEIHKPDLWIFGHHHISKRGMIDGVEFIALDELAFIDIEWS